MRYLPLLPFLLVFGCNAVHADWGVDGVAIRCDQKGGTFEVAPVVELSSADPGEVPVKTGFTRLPDGKSEFRCKLGGKTVRTSIRVYGPKEMGMCMGAGYVSIEKLTVGRTQLVRPGEDFNWHCIYDPIVVKYLVRKIGSKHSFERCTADEWNWGKGFTGIKCTVTNVR